MLTSLDSAIGGAMASVRSSRGLAVLYCRGESSVVVTAVVGSTVETSEADYGLVVERRARDYLIAAADLLMATVAIVPQRGDRIHEMLADGSVLIFEVNPAVGEPPYRFMDPGRTQLRIHAQRVDTDLNGAVTVAGSPTPDVSGTFTAVGWNDGVRFYSRSGPYYLFRYTVDHLWYISPAVNVPGADHFVADWGGAPDGLQSLFDGIGAWSGYALAGAAPVTDRAVDEQTPPVAPDCTGTFLLQPELWNARPIWWNETPNQILAYDAVTGKWTISTHPQPAGDVADCWTCDTRNGIYAPQGTYTGSPEVHQPGA